MASTCAQSYASSSAKHGGVLDKKGRVLDVSGSARSRVVGKVSHSTKRPSALPEKSTDSSAISGVTLGSRGCSLLVTDAASPSAKRLCSNGLADSCVKGKWLDRGGKHCKALLTGESDISSTISSDAVEDPPLANGHRAESATKPTANPDQATSPPVDAAKVMDNAGQHTGPNPKSSSAEEIQKPTCNVDEQHLDSYCQDVNQDSQSDSALDGADAPEASEPQCTEGTVSSDGKSGKGTPNNKRKVKVDWTPELHRKFVQAVEQLGVEKAIPSRILEIMNVKCLTRHNIASHLQKYRSHRRHLAAREAEAANWQQQRKVAEAPIWPAAKPGVGPYGWGPFGGPAMPGAPPAAYAAGMPPAAPVPGRPVMGMPQPGMVQGVPMGTPMGQPVTMGQPQPAAGTPVMGMPLPMQVWGHPTVDHSQAHMWQRPGAGFPMPPPAWYGPDGSVWHYPAPFQSAPPMDMWGPPVPGYPGGGMVAGTPCFPPQPMQMQGIPQRIPSGISTTGSVSFTPAGSPAGQASSAKESPASDCPPTPGPAASAAAAVPGGALAEAAEADGSLDAFLDEELPDSMFNLPEDLSMNFTYGTNAGSSEMQDPGLIDAAITEALNNPLTPLPLGLKPPSVDCVLEELSKQGISMLPPLKSSSSAPVDAKAELFGDDAMGEVDDHALMLAGEIGEEGLSEDALNALLQP